MNSHFPFHLAIPVSNLALMRDFYVENLGCKIGRSADSWVDLDLYGHQLVLHQVKHLERIGGTNPVDGKEIRVPHFGVVLPWKDWESLSNSLKNRNVKFIIEPYIRFEGKVGEQATLFFEDPEKNALEFKSFKDPTQLFAN